MSAARKKMRLGRVAALGREHAFGFDRGLRRLRKDDETAFLLSSPENARRLRRALDDARAGRGLVFESIEDLRAALGLDPER